MFVSDANAVRQTWLLDGAQAGLGRLHGGLVSRKKQLLPLLFKRLDTFRE
jgi:hypothetical protein